MKRILCALSLALLVLVSMRAGSSVGAQDSGSWLTPNPLLGQRRESPAGLPESVAVAGNIPCQTRSFVTRPAIPPLQAPVTSSACAVQTAHGWTASSGYTDEFGSDAKLFKDNGGSVVFYAVPGGSAGVMLESTSLGTRLHYYAAGVHASRREFNQTTRELKVFLSTTPSWTLKDKAGKIIHVRADSLAFSSNGQWLVVDVPFLATLRVELATGSIVPFSSPYNYHLGFSVSPNLAVSDDGNFVVKASDSGDFKITDLSSCAAVPDSITGPVSCRSATHDAWFRTQVPGYWRVFQPRFISERQIELFIGYNNTPSTRTWARFRLVPAGDTIPKHDYLALGDSYSSGEGAYDYFSETDTDANRCHLSKQSYPYLIGRQLQFSEFNSAACSGAKITDITTYVQKRQLPSPNSMGRLLPGFKKQIQYVRDQNPRLLSVGIGGNDVGLPSRLKTCLNVGTCYQTYEDRLEIVHEINAQFSRLVDLFTQLKASLKNDSRIYAVGYPEIAAAGGRCGVSIPLNGEELMFVNQAIDYLNQVTELASRRAGVLFVDVKDAFDGHQLCQEGADKLAMHGITFGNDFFLSIGPFGNESFHPTAFGHELYTRTILERTTNLSAPAPAADPSLTAPPETPDSPLLNAPKSNRPINAPVFDDTISADILVRQSPVSVSVDGLIHALQPGTSYTIEIRSTPQNIGTAVVQPDGQIQASITVPENIEPGFHSLHILGVSLMGVRQDIYKIVYVAAGFSDLDGDGFRNDLDSCNGYTNLGRDDDSDGLDDACDDSVEIAESPDPDPEKESSKESVGEELASGEDIETSSPHKEKSADMNKPAHESTELEQPKEPSPNRVLGILDKLIKPVKTVIDWQPYQYHAYIRIIVLIVTLAGLGILLIYNRRR